ncbi:hypothetical protein QR680_005483 [Steinernema hermaphroditum]|uniref:EB domain-containing protein n=1 Tax=Steinernema hermaphroditum TaxID=289476 RepID=A0AA39HUF3_9BILA|nr:hypothetical protein QR680_005483 [Steinernema hermaphroditum]
MPEPLYSAHRSRSTMDSHLVLLLALLLSLVAAQSCPASTAPLRGGVTCQFDQLCTGYDQNAFCYRGFCCSEQNFGVGQCGFRQFKINGFCYSVASHLQRCDLSEQCSFSGGLCLSNVCRCSPGLVFANNQCQLDPSIVPTPMNRELPSALPGNCYSISGVNGPCIYDAQCQEPGNNQLFCQRGFCQYRTSGYATCQVARMQPEIVNGIVKNCLREYCSSGYRCEYNRNFNGGQYICCGSSSSAFFGVVKMYPGTSMPLQCHAVNSCTFVDFPHCVFSSRYGYNRRRSVATPLSPPGGQRRECEAMTDLDDTPEMVIRRRKSAKEAVDPEESELENSPQPKAPIPLSSREGSPRVCKQSKGNRSVKLEEPLEIDVGVRGAETEPTEPSEKPSGEAPIGIFDFVWKELTRGYNLEKDSSRYTEKTRKVCAFLWIPYELECFLFFGFLQCVDAFCHLITFLPIRLFMAFVGFVTGRRSWTPAVTCDFIKLLIVVTTAYMTQYFVDTSMIYHIVRGQSVIKLYICYNMLEVADKLFSSFGQDILDSCFWKAATCLNVAFNSQNQALLAIMLSNNFVELKGSVFKKLGKPNLFQMSCSDVRERFHILVLLVVVVMRNMMAVNWNFEHLIEMLPDLVCVICGELGVDWLKHAFITKFNEINAKVYEDFTTTIAFDVVRGHDEGAYSDYSDQVSRRMGFIPIPLTVVLIRVIGQSINMEGRVTVFLFVLTWILILTVKILNGIVIYGQACNHVKRYRNLQAQAEFDVYRRRMVTKKSKSVPNSPRMSLIDFSDVLHQPGPSKGFTISDVITQWDELSRSAAEIGQKEDHKEQMVVEGLLSAEPPSPAPRRTQSMIFVQNRHTRDKSLPPSTAIPEGEEREDSVESQKENVTQLSPKRKVPTIECESLTDIQAYTMLGKEADGIQS